MPNSDGTMVPDFTLHFLLTIAIDIEHAECLLEISNLFLTKISAGHDELKMAVRLVLWLERSGSSAVSAICGWLFLLGIPMPFFHVHVCAMRAGGGWGICG